MSEPTSELGADVFARHKTNTGTMHSAEGGGGGEGEDDLSQDQTSEDILVDMVALRQSGDTTWFQQIRPKFHLRAKKNGTPRFFFNTDKVHILTARARGAYG